MYDQRPLRLTVEGVDAPFFAAVPRRSSCRGRGSCSCGGTTKDCDQLFADEFLHQLDQAEQTNSRLELMVSPSRVV